MNRKVLALVLLIAPLVFSFVTAPAIGQYSYALSSAGASAEEVLAFEAGALVVGLAFGLPGMVFAVSYGTISLL